MSSTIVIDNGSCSIKAGFENNDLPLCVFNTVLGCPPPKSISSSNDNQELRLSNDWVFGSAALRKRGLFSLRYPIEHGIVVDWDHMQKLWKHTFFDELRVDPSQHSLFITEATLNPRENREKTAQIMFETFNIQSMCTGAQSTLALYSSGRTTGLILESGEGVTHACPIYEGFSLPQAILRLDIGGRDVTQYLTKLLADMGHNFFTSAEREVVRAIKEDVCFIANNFEKEVQKIDMNEENQISYELPDGNSIKLGSIRFQAPEIIFQPQFIGNDQLGIAELVCESIKKCEIDIRRTFFHNIVLTGGNLMFNGLHERLHQSLINATPDSVRIKIAQNPNMKYCVWTGASILANMKSFRENWMTAEEYKEVGVGRINDKLL